MNERVDHLAKPPAIRLADMLTLGGVLIGIATLLVTALNLSGRIDHVDDHVTHAADQLSAQITRLDDRQRAADERTSRLEGRLQPVKP